MSSITLSQLQQRRSSKPSVQQDITVLLQQQHRKIKPILGDGNCFFWSLSWFLYNNQEEHMMVRNVLVQFISDHKDHFSGLVIDPEGTETIESHITKMRKPKFWASQIEIQAAADFYAVPVYIYTPTLDMGITGCNTHQGCSLHPT